MNILNVYNYYIVCKLHYFNKKYDMYKYNFKTNINSESFDSRNDKLMFYIILKRIKKIDELIKYFSSYMVSLGNIHISKMIDDDFKIYNNHISLIESFSRIFEEDLIKLKELNKNNVSYFYTINDKPFLFESMLYNDINMETIIMFDYFSKNKLFKLWETINDTYMKKLLLLLTKYELYLVKNINIKKTYSIFLNWIKKI